MNPPIVYPLTNPRSHRTMRITKIVHSILILLSFSVVTNHPAINLIQSYSAACDSGDFARLLQVFHKIPACQGLRFSEDYQYRPPSSEISSFSLWRKTL